MMKELTKKCVLPLAAVLSLVASSGSLNADFGGCCGEDDSSLGFTVGAEFLYWEACHTHRPFATVESTTGGETTFGGGGHFDQRWKPGFRVFAGVENLLCDWDFLFAYTWIRHHHSSSLSADPGEVIVTPFATFLTPGTGFEFASGSHSLKTQYWDLLFSHKYQFCDCHYFVPFFGVEVLKIDRHLGATFTPFAPTPGEFTVHWNSKFTGAGLKAGAAYEYQWDECFSFYSKSSFALIAGHNKFHLSGSGIADFAISNSGHNHHCRLLPVADISVGLKYTWNVCDMPIYLKLGYEFLYFFNLSNWDGHSDLGYQGLSVGAAVKF